MEENCGVPAPTPAPITANPTPAPITPSPTPSPTPAPITPSPTPSCSDLCCYPIDNDGNGGWTNSYMLGVCEQNGCHYVMWSNGSPYCSGTNYYHQCMEENCGVPAPTPAPITANPTPAPITASPPPSQTPGSCLDVQLQLKTDNWGSETSWQLKENGAPLVSNSNTYSSGTEYNQNLGCLPIGANEYERYEFTINDSYGDGICCSYGAGFYKLKVNEEIVKEGGNFASSESFKFPVDPNYSPPNFRLVLNTDYWGYESSWTVKNAGGVMLHSGSGYGNSNTYTVDLMLSPDECYTFTMNDSYGDGILYGSYEVYWNNVQAIYVEGNFGVSRSDTFGACPDADTVPIVPGDVTIRDPPRGKDKNNGKGNNKKDNDNKGTNKFGNKFKNGK